MATSLAFAGAAHATAAQGDICFPRPGTISANDVALNWRPLIQGLVSTAGLFSALATTPAIIPLILSANAPRVEGAVNYEPEAILHPKPLLKYAKPFKPALKLGA